MLEELEGVQVISMKLAKKRGRPRKNKNFMAQTLAYYSRYNFNLNEFDLSRDALNER